MTEQPQPALKSRDWAAILFALVLPSIVTWVYFFRAEAFAPSTQLAIYNIAKAIQFVFPAAWVLAAQRRRITLRPRGTAGVGIGLLFGAAVALAMLALYYFVLRLSPILEAPAGEINVKVQRFGIDNLWQYAALGAFYSLFHSLMEEYYWRWFVFGELRRGMPLGAAVAISSLGFMAHHVLVLGRFFGFDHWATWLFSSCVAIGGVVWAWLYNRTGSLLGPWLSHLLVDAAIFSIGYDLVRARLDS